jgi:Skp family chaperone for outer membrane proteins
VLSPVTLSSQEAPDAIESYLPRLYAIATQYETLTKSLQAELTASQLNLTELGQKLADSQASSVTLLDRLARSEAESKTLKESHDSLTQAISTSGESWTKYAMESEKEKTRLEKRARLWSFIGKLSLLVAAGEGAYIAVNHFF